MDEERRASSRQLTCIPAFIGSSNNSEQLALIHDASPDGALLFTRSQMELGERVDLSLYLLPEHEPPRCVSGKVVRIQRRDRDRSDVWHWEIAVQFDEPITQYAPEIEALCERQRAVGVLRG